MTTQLDSLRNMTVVVADTGDIDAIKKYQPQDATTNPSLILSASALPQYAPLIDEAIAYAKAQSADKAQQLIDAEDKLAVNIGLEILKIVPGRISTEVDARLSYDTQATVEKARKLIALYNAAGISNDRILIKIASTWQGIRAAEILEKEGIQSILNMPSATCSVTIPEIRKLGGHQGEPGHALTGTTPLHAVLDLPEIPALVYVSEISHNLDGHSYFYGGGYYRRGHFENVEVVNGDNVVFDTVLPLKDESIDYYIETKNEHPVGGTVIGSFRTQIFVTRSDLAIVSGLQSGKPHLVGIYDSLGNKVRR